MNIIQFGNGRWGQNHKRILKSLGHSVATYDVEDRWWDILDCQVERIDAVVVTTSSVNHWPIAKVCMDKSIPVFVEKPVLLKRSQLEDLKQRENHKLFMAGHQLLFMPEMAMIKGQVNYMNSLRSGAIPRTEGSLFSLMVHDIAVAHYVTGENEFECILAEGNRHEVKATLVAGEKIVELYAVSISKVRLRHTVFILEDDTVHLTPDNWNRPDLLEKELQTFCAYVRKTYPINFNGTTQAIQVMETVFKIQERLNSTIK